MSAHLAVVHLCCSPPSCVDSQPSSCPWSGPAEYDPTASEVVPDGGEVPSLHGASPPPPCKPSFPHAECPTLNKVCNHINTSVQSIHQSTLLSELGSPARRGYYNGGMLANPVVK